MEKKVIVITGASSGIGFAVGEYLAGKGYEVFGLARSSRQSSKITFINCDVTIREQVESAFKAIDSKIYAVINNAGIGISGPIEYADDNDIDNIINVNIRGIVNVVQTAIPYLRDTKGRIINIGSVASDITIPFQGFYSLTKASVHVLTEALALELRPWGIKVTTVSPGDTKSNFVDNRVKGKIKGDVYGERIKASVEKMEKDERKGKDPLTVARVIHRVLKRNRPPLKVTVGLEYKILVFLKRLLPLKFVNWVVYRMYGGSNE